MKNISNYKWLMKTLPNGYIRFKGSIDQVLLFLKEQDGWDDIKEVEITNRYFFFGEFICDITIGKKTN